MSSLMNSWKATRCGGFSLTPLVLALLLIATGSCGWYLVSTLPRDRFAEGRVHLVVLTHPDLRDYAYFKATVDRFMREHPHITVEVRRTPELYRKLAAMIAGKAAPDLTWMGYAFSEFADRGAFLDITDRFKRDYPTHDFLPHVLKWYQVRKRMEDGTIQPRQMGVPYSIDMTFVVYNRRLFDEADVPHPTNDWTFDDFLGAARKLTVRDEDGRVVQWGFRGVVPMHLFGAEFFSADGQTPLCNTPEMINYLKTNVALFREHRVMPQPGRLDEQRLDRYELFRSGKFAMMQFFTGYLPHAADKFADMDWDIALDPKVKRRGQWASSGAILTTAQTKHPDEAWLLCREFFGREFQQLMAYRGLPSDETVARRAYLGHVGKPQNLKVLYETRNHLFPTPRVPNAVELTEICLQGHEAVWAQRLTPEAAMAQAEKQMRDTIRKNNERRQRSE